MSYVELLKRIGLLVVIDSPLAQAAPAPPTVKATHAAPRITSLGQHAGDTKQIHK